MSRKAAKIILLCVFAPLHETSNFRYSLIPLAAKMTDEEAVEFYMSRFSLRMWQRLTFFIALLALGWWFTIPLFWDVGQTFINITFFCIAPIYLISVVVWTLSTVPKHFLILRELRKQGYEKWRMLQWNPMFLKRWIKLLLLTEHQRQKYPWLMPISLGVLILPIVGFIVTIVRFLCKC